MCVLCAYCVVCLSSSNANVTVVKTKAKKKTDEAFRMPCWFDDDHDGLKTSNITTRHTKKRRGSGGGGEEET